RQIKRVNTLSEYTFLVLGCRRNKNRAADRIDHRRRSYSDFRTHRVYLVAVRGNRCDAGLEVDETMMPYRSGKQAVGVEGIRAVVFGHYVYDVVHSLVRNLDVWNVERLGEDRAVDRV